MSKHKNTRCFILTNMSSTKICFAYFIEASNRCQIANIVCYDSLWEAKTPLVFANKNIEKALLFIVFSFEVYQLTIPIKNLSDTAYNLLTNYFLKWKMFRLFLHKKILYVFNELLPRNVILTQILAKAFILLDEKYYKKSCFSKLTYIQVSFQCFA